MITREELERRRMESSANLALARAADGLAGMAALRSGQYSATTSATGFYTTDGGDNPVYTNYFKAGDVVGTFVLAP